MPRSSIRLVSIFSILTVLASFLTAATIRVEPATARDASHAGTTTGLQSLTQLEPVVRTAERSDRSLPLRELPPAQPRRAGLSAPGELPRRTGPLAPGASSTSEVDPVVQREFLSQNAPALVANFDGMSNVDDVVPADTVGDVGLNHYVQMINNQFAIYSKSGAPLYGPRPISSIWDGFGGLCETTNQGDPIVLYDQFSDRWLLSKFAFIGSGSDGPFYECIAISQSADPTGAYYRYAFKYSDTKFNDYPKLGVGPTGYFMSAVQFQSATYSGMGVVAFEREKMLVGDPNARMIAFDLGQVAPAFFGLLPADVDGPPPPGAPHYFATVMDGDEIGPSDALYLWAFDVDWANPAQSTFGNSGQPNHVLPVAPFNRMPCMYCIPQPGSAVRLDSLSDRPMHRLQYRNFSSYDALVLNHTVDAGGGTAGVRWYEVRNPSSSPAIHQQGTYAPDAAQRWMASLAMDRHGNIAVGYNVSSVDVYPSIRYAARLAGDPSGTLAQGEGTIIAGGGSQTSSFGRWGDYSSMNVDPVDDCTFWYTSQYMPQTSEVEWQTRIAAFKLPTCSAQETGVLTGIVRDAQTAEPLANATVTAGGYLTISDEDGRYRFLHLPSGTYTVTARLYGYREQAVGSISVAQDTTTTQDFQLEPVQRLLLQGRVIDSAHGWPLYARVEVTINELVWTTYTDPATGLYSIELAEGERHMLEVEAEGYAAASRTVVPSAEGGPENFVLQILPSCDAPGYRLSSAVVLAESFDEQRLPAGWQNIDNISSHTSPQNWRFDDPGATGNRTGGSGGLAIVDSDYYGEGNSQDTELRTPAIDLRGWPQVLLEFDTDFAYWGGEVADVDVSVDGGTTWTNVWRKTSAYRGPSHERLDLTSVAANQPDVRVRFHYDNATYALHWQVDNVRVTGTRCDILSGGLLVGHVYDANTGAGINGATVRSRAAPSQSATTFATPDDPRLDDGLYILFSSVSGEGSFTAAMSNYVELSQSLVVMADAAVQQDFQLPAGRLAATPQRLSATLQAGSRTTSTLVINNTGSAGASFSLVEYNGAAPANQEGLPRYKRDSGRFLGDATLVRDSSTGFWYGPRSGQQGPVGAGPLAEPWLTAAPLPQAVSRAAGAVVGDMFYVIGGIAPQATVFGGVQVYDPDAGQWSSSAVAAMPTPLSNSCAAAIGTDIYLVGGTDGSYAATTVLQVLHTKTGQWETLASDPLPAPRYGVACTAHDGKLYVFGGSDGAAAGDNAWVYDPAQAAGERWRSLPATPVQAGAVFGGAAAIGSQIFYAGFVEPETAGLNSAAVYAYDVGTRSWQAYPQLQEPRGGAHVWAIGATVYVGGGGWSSYRTSVEAYDTSQGPQGRWTTTKALVQGRRSAASAVDAGRGMLYAAGGWTGTHLASVEYNRAAVDVPWLGESPVSGTVDVGASAQITVTFDASALQPGTYSAELEVTEDTPYSVSRIPVQLEVLPWPNAVYLPLVAATAPQ